MICFTQEQFLSIKQPYKRGKHYVFNQSKDYKLNDLLSKYSVFLHWGYVEAAALQILTQQ